MARMGNRGRLFLICSLLGQGWVIPQCKKCVPGETEYALSMALGTRAGARHATFVL